MSSSVILDSASKWSLWFSELQSIAALGGVWPYLDPHLDEGVQIPSCPAQPVVADIRHRATNMKDLSVDEQSLYLLELQIWQEAQNKILQVQNSLCDVSYFIDLSVPSEF